jgi:hypothetical protein
METSGLMVPVRETRRPSLPLLTIALISRTPLIERAVFLTRFSTASRLIWTSPRAVSWMTGSPPPLNKKNFDYLNIIICENLINAGQIKSRKAKE